MGAKASIYDKSIKLSNKGIEDIEADVKNVDLVAGFLSPKALDLSHNKISSIPPRICRSVAKAPAIIEHLRKVDLSNNSLKQVPNAFFLLVNMTKLKLDHNMLDTIPKKLASSLYNLEGRFCP